MITRCITPGLGPACTTHPLRMQDDGDPNPVMENLCSVDPLPPGGLNAGMQSPETVPRGGDSAGRDWLCFVGTEGGKSVQLVGSMVVLPESLQRGLCVPTVIYGGIPPTQLVFTWKAPRNAYDRAMAAY